MTLVGKATLNSKSRFTAGKSITTAEAAPRNLQSKCLTLLYNLGYIMWIWENLVQSLAYLTFPLSVVDLEVDVADGEAAVPLHHGHAVLAGEEAHRLRNRNAMSRMDKSE